MRCCACFSNGKLKVCNQWDPFLMLDEKKVAIAVCKRLCFKIQNWCNGLLPWEKHWLTKATWPDTRYSCSCAETDCSDGIVMKLYAAQAFEQTQRGSWMDPHHQNWIHCCSSRISSSNNNYSICKGPILAATIQGTCIKSCMHNYIPLIHT